VERQKKIKVIELNVEVPEDNNLYHKYYCRRCELDFAVSQKFQEQDIVACNGCRKDDQLEDRGEATLYKGVILHG
jgi:DNA-directed RNA polymerase subunit RPC12/RpoP